jgi:hypothetical protein
MPSFSEKMTELRRLRRLENKQAIHCVLVKYCCHAIKCQLEWVVSFVVVVTK